MDSTHAFISFLITIGLIILVVIVALVATMFKLLDAGLIAFLGMVTTGAFAIISRPTSKNVTVDNGSNDPVPVASDDAK